MNLSNIFKEKNLLHYRFSTLITLTLIFYLSFFNGYVCKIEGYKTLLFIILTIISVIVLQILYYENRNILLCYIFVITPIVIYIIVNKYLALKSNDENKLREKFFKEFKENVIGDNIQIMEPRPHFVGVNKNSNDGQQVPTRAVPNRTNSGSMNMTGNMSHLSDNYISGRNNSNNMNNNGMMNGGMMMDNPGDFSSFGSSSISPMFENNIM